MANAYKYGPNDSVIVTDPAKPTEISTFSKVDSLGNPTLEWFNIEPAVISGDIVILPADPPPLVFSTTQSVHGQIRTTDATPTEVVRITLAPQTGYTGQVNVIGVDSGNGALRVIRTSFAIKRLNAGAVSVGAPVVLASHTDAAASSWNIGASVSGNDAIVTVVGAAGRTIDWLCEGAMISFTPAGN